MRRLYPLQPAFPLEINIRQSRRDDHQDDRQGIADGPAELGHVVEVHAVDARDQGRRHQGDARHRKNLDDVVLFDVDETERGLQQEIDFAGEKRRVIGKRRRVVSQRIDVPAQFGGEACAHALGDERQHPAQRNQTFPRL